MSKAARHPLSLEQVRHVAKLARVELTDQQLQTYQSQLASILEYIDMLNELDVTGIEPMAHPLDLANRLDEDEIGPALATEDLLRNAPAVEDRYLAVPKVLADEG